MRRLSSVAPLLRGRLARVTGDPDCPYQRMVLRPLVTPEILAFLDSAEAQTLALSPPLTPDHLIRSQVLYPAELPVRYLRTNYSFEYKQEIFINYKIKVLVN